MPTTLTYTVTQTSPAPGEYQVTFVVIDAVGISRHVFVFDSQYQAFTGVATPYDMRVWPDVRDLNYMSYRAPTLQRTYATIEEAEEFAVYTRARLATLRTEWEQYNDDFESITTYVTPPES